jgi:hypothetical protein
MNPLAVPELFRAWSAQKFRPPRNKSICFICHRQRKLIYSHSFDRSVKTVILGIFGTILCLFAS